MGRLAFQLKIFLILTTIFASLISASCSEGEVDINSASVEELDALSGIGPAKAQEIVNARPFDSVDELIDVKGIGEVTLNNIKTQGLACVEQESNEDDSEEEQEKKDIKVTEQEELEVNSISSSSIKEPEVIFLGASESAKAIKTAEPKDFNQKVAMFGLVAFCVLLAILFVIKNKGRKNEFRR